ncbi:MAG TPA: MBL fold metallo-hydrolase [Patescibacteria group bacterium]|nr:MBL fold metallo-hydrolase [Patescibacteria group bacterium]
MKLKFLGAAGTVTGSSYILTSGSGQSILIDLGMFQGTEKDDKFNYLPYEYDCSRLNAALLTHAHLDHCGRLPILLSNGFTGDIWMTPATRDLTEITLLDSAKVARQDKKPILYDKDLAEQTIQKFQTIEYHEQKLIGDFTVTYYNAGHILGSASIVIEDTKADSNFRRIIFSGDIGNFPEPLQQSTEFLDSTDVVVMESTYGDRLHPKEDVVATVISEINTVEKSGGVLLIPAFSLERTQELLHMFMHLKKENKIRHETPIFIDGPMGEKATLIYNQYAKLFNSEVQSDFNHGNPFEFPGMQVVHSREQSEAIYETPGPKVIMAGSGMMTGGRIVGHAAHYLPMPSTRLLIVGYQGEETLGRQLMEGNRQVMIDKQSISVKATVSDTQAMSSHADQSQLLEWLKAIKGVKRVILTHGEDTSRQALAEKITTDLHLGDILLPRLNEELGL